MNGLWIIVIFYVLGVNIYGFLLVMTAKKEAIRSLPACDAEGGACETTETPPVESDCTALCINDGASDNKDGSSEKKTQKETEKHLMKKDLSRKKVDALAIFFASALGGALSVYVSMLIFKYRLKNIFLMLSIPALIGLDVFVTFSLTSFSIPLI